MGSDRSLLYTAVHRVLQVAADAVTADADAAALMLLMLVVWTGGDAGLPGPASGKS